MYWTRFAWSLFGVVMLVGCTTTPVERQERTVTSVDETRKDMADMRSHVDRTLQSLNVLMNAAPSDIQKAYSRYARNVDIMRKDAAVLDRNADVMQKQTGDYLAAWQRAQSQIQSPELRTLTGERREQITHSFQRIGVAFREARRDITPFLTRLEDIRRAAASDLTPVGLAAISQTDAVASANAQGSSVAASLDVAIAEFDQLVGALAASPR